MRTNGRERLAKIVKHAREQTALNTSLEGGKDKVGYSIVRKYTKQGHPPTFFSLTINDPAAS